MFKRILTHIGFWLAVIAFMALVKSSFPSTSDEKLSSMHRYAKNIFSEFVFLPWKIIPFYFFFYLFLPKHKKENLFQLIIQSLGCLIICILCYRSLVVPISKLLYGDQPNFNVFSWNRILYTLIDILPFIAIGSTIKLVKMRLDENEKSNALNKEKLETELKFLKAQTNPHFLFNTLNNIYGLARKQDQNTAPSIMKLSHIMRYILYECNQPFILIDKEIEIINHYIELEKLRYTDRLKVDFTYIDRAINTIKIAPLILLPFVENAFKHGISESRFEAFVFIKLESSDQAIKFCVENTCDHSDNSNLGIGLQNVKRQLELIYHSKFILDIKNEHKIHSISLQLTLK